MNTQNFRNKLIATLLLVFTTLLSGKLVLAAPIKVVASIKPIALIVEPLLVEGDQIEVLLPVSASPHLYALKVSDMKRLSDADLVIWVGPQMERFLEKALGSLERDRQLRLDSAEAESSNQDQSQSAQSNSLDLAHNHNHGEDPHLWLGPGAAISLTEQVGKRLARLNPEHQSEYRQRIETQKQKYDVLHRQLQQKFEAAYSMAFIAYHPAYSELVNTYGLNQVGTVTRSPELAPGARHLAELQNLVKAARARCLFVEVSHASPRVESIAEQLGLRLALLDPIGQSPTVSRYEQLMSQLADAMVNCLVRD